MCLPDDGGTLIGGLIITRVKAPDVFLSNAGHTSRLNIPGTGEGYGVVGGLRDGVGGLRVPIRRS